MDEDVEQVPLTGRRGKTLGPKVIAGLIIAIVVFSFFGFVFSTAGFNEILHLNTGVTSNFYNQQGGLIEEDYTIPAGIPAFAAGTVVSYCDGTTPIGGICPGLGPRWNTTLYPPGSFAPASFADLAQISPSVALYVWVAPGYPNILRLTSIRTDSDPPAYIGAPVLYTATDPITWVSVKTYSETGAAVVFNMHNSSYIVAVGVALTAAPLLGSPQFMFEVTNTVDGFIIDTVVLQNTVILVSYGPNTNGATFLGFTISGTNTLTSVNIPKTGYGVQITNALSSVFLGTSGGVNYLLQASGDKAALASFSYSANTNSLTISSLTTLTYTSVLFESITAQSLFNGYIALAGVQTALLQNALTVSLVLQWATTSPYLTSYYPNNLLEGQGHQLINNFLSSCYAPASNGEPRGELFYAYVDFVSDRAKLIRAKIATTGSNDVQILPSPPVDISTFTYTQYGISIGPLVACPSPSGVLVAYQYLGTYFNSFVWEGGYRFAGIAQENYGGAETTIRVMRQGISDIHTQLQPGFPYYTTNSGHLHAHTTIVELFTSSSFNTRIGVALTDKQILIDDRVWENLGIYGGGN